MRDRFQFLKSFADTIQNVSKADEMLAKDLAMKIINYWIFGIEENSGNAILEALFVQIKMMIDKGNEIAEKRKEANKLRKNIEQKMNKNEQNLTNDEQKWTNDEQNEPKKKIENNKKEKIKKENNNNINVVTEQSSGYGDQDINLCIDLIKKYNGWLIDGTVKKQRQYWKLLINKLKKLESIKNWEYTWNNTLEIILKIISNNKFYCSKITSPENIYNNLAVLMQQCKNDFRKTNTSNTILETI